jgi:hypothetical protein
MKKLVTLMVMLVVGITAQAKCDFSGITFEKFSQRGNEMYFRTNMKWDSCWDYVFTAYDYQLKRVDTLDDWGGRTGVSFNTKGKYQMRLNVVNRCEKCDTVLTIDIDITIFNRLGFDYKVSPKDCKSYQFELAERDTCTQYYFNIYKADKWINSLTDDQWVNLSDSALYFGYSWAEDLMLYASTKSESKIDFEFKDSGRYFIIPMLYNTCTGIDTWAMKKLDVCLDYKLNNKQPVVKPTDIKIIGYYDLMGRQVDAIEPNKIYIIHYSNGQRRKVMQVQN